VADSGRIERVTLARGFYVERNGVKGGAAKDDPAATPSPWQIPTSWERRNPRMYEISTFIPESAHYSEIERLAGELEARAEKADRECDEDWSETAKPRRIHLLARRDALREAASLTRRERE
jgi:hypothetical protein